MPGTDESETDGAHSAAAMAFAERDLAEGVTHWLLANFQRELGDATRSTPFTVPLLCAIACREAGAYWLPLTPHRSAAEILGLCVYDASGDVAGAPRNAFPVNTAEFRLAYGEAFTAMLISEANKAEADAHGEDFRWTPRRATNGLRSDIRPVACSLDMGSIPRIEARARRVRPSEPARRRSPPRCWRR